MMGMAQRPRLDVCNTSTSGRDMKDMKAMNRWCSMHIYSCAKIVQDGPDLVVMIPTQSKYR